MQFTRGQTIGIRPHLNDIVREHNAINVSYSIVIIAVLITQIIFVWRNRYFIVYGAICRTVRLNVARHIDPRSCPTATGNRARPLFRIMISIQ